jgi:DNA polymerase III subunit chi
MSLDLEFSFYHLTTTPLIKALPKILEKILTAKQKAVILFPNEESMEEMNRYLWSFSTLNIIPHGSCNDIYPEEQPIYLTTQDENPNKASIKIMVGGAFSENFFGFKKVLYFFDENIEGEQELARERFKLLKDKSIDTVYWQQQDKGAWEKK